MVSWRRLKELEQKAIKLDEVCQILYLEQYLAIELHRLMFVYFFLFGRKVTATALVKMVQFFLR